MSAPSDNRMPEILTGDQRERVQRSIARRRRQAKVFRRACLALAGVSVALLVVFLIVIIVQGSSRFTPALLTQPPSPQADQAGMAPAIWGTVWLLLLVALFALPMGVGTAILLEEFRPRNRMMGHLFDGIQANITNLAGVPSVVYGILGLTVFVSLFQLSGGQAQPVLEWGVRYYDQFYSEAGQVLLVPVENPDARPVAPEQHMPALTADFKPVELYVIDGSDPWPTDPDLAARTLRRTDVAGRIEEHRWYYFRVPFGRGVLAGALTLMLVILPIVIIASQEALRAVPASLREAAFGLGATRWQVVRGVTLPAALPGILTGAILAMSRAIGEAAPILMIAGIVFISNAPGNLMDDFTAMPLQIFNWVQRPQAEFHELAASGILVLLSVLFCFNAAAAIIRHKLGRPLR